MLEAKSISFTLNVNYNRQDNYIHVEYTFYYCILTRTKKYCDRELWKRSLLRGVVSQNHCAKSSIVFFKYTLIKLDIKAIFNLVY